MKRIEDAELGTLIGIAEVSELTGITKAQLRNWRKPEHVHLARLEGYQNPFSRDVWYRLLDVEKYLAENGVQMGATSFAPIGSPNAVKAPLLDANLSHRQMKGKSMLLEITPENVYAVRERFMTKNREIAYDYATKRERQFIKEIVGDYDPMTRPINFETRFSEPDWFTASVKAMRLAQNEIAGLGFSEEEVLALPIGQVPPLRETK